VTTLILGNVSSALAASGGRMVAVVFAPLVAVLALLEVVVTVPPVTVEVLVFPSSYPSFGVVVAVA